MKRRAPRTASRTGNFMTKSEPLERSLYVAVPRGTDIDALEPLREEPTAHGNNHLQIKVRQAVKPEGAPGSMRAWSAEHKVAPGSWREQVQKRR